MAKPTTRRGINPLTEAELTNYTPEQKHNSVALRNIPMQSPLGFYWVKLRNVCTRIEQGWVLKIQNPLQQWKLGMAKIINMNHQKSVLTTKQAYTLYDLVSAATAPEMREVQEQVNKTIFQHLNK